MKEEHTCKDCLRSCDPDSERCEDCQAAIDDAESCPTCGCRNTGGDECDGCEEINREEGDYALDNE